MNIDSINPEFVFCDNMKQVLSSFLVQLVKPVPLLLWADYVTLKVAPQAISENLQKDPEETRVWSIKNKMVLSDSKTKCMLVTGKRLESKFSDNCSLHLKLNGTEIKQVNSQKLLGVTIDNKLSFDDHIERLCKKLTQKIAVLRKIRRFLPLEERKLYYNAMIKQSML